MSQMAYLAFGNGVLQPGESTKEAMRDAAEQVKKGEIPTISLNPEGFWAIPGYKLDPVYQVELGIIGAALFGASLTAYLLQASTLVTCHTNVTCPPLYRVLRDAVPHSSLQCDCHVSQMWPELSKVTNETVCFCAHHAADASSSQETYRSRQLVCCIHHYRNVHIYSKDVGSSDNHMAISQLDGRNDRDKWTWLSASALPEP